MTRRLTQQHVRDWACVLLGLGVVAHQAFVVAPGQASEMLVIAGITLATGPALGGALGLARRDGTGSGSDSPPSLSPSPSSSSRSAPSSGADPP